jgi:hypothetical protein
MHRARCRTLLKDLLVCVLFLLSLFLCSRQSVLSYRSASLIVADIIAVIVRANIIHSSSLIQHQHHQATTTSIQYCTAHLTAEWTGPTVVVRSFRSD